MDGAVAYCRVSQAAVGANRHFRHWLFGCIHSGGTAPYSDEIFDSSRVFSHHLTVNAISIRKDPFHDVNVHPFGQIALTCSKDVVVGGIGVELGGGEISSQFLGHFLVGEQLEQSES